MRSVASRDSFDDLVVAIEKTGYYPQVVSAGVRAAVAGEEVVSFLVHHEPTIDRDEVRRHITVVVLTSTRLILCHTDEHAPDDPLPAPTPSATPTMATPACSPPMTSRSGCARASPRASMGACPIADGM